LRRWKSLLAPLFKEFKPNAEINDDNGSFQRLTYRESLLRYGTDKPDLRIAAEIEDLTPLFAKSEFKAFAGKTVRAMAIPQAFDQPRSWFDNLQEEAKKLGAPGLAYVKIGPAEPVEVKSISGEKSVLPPSGQINLGNGIAMSGPIAKFMVSDSVKEALLKLCGAVPPGDTFSKTIWEGRDLILEQKPQLKDALKTRPWIVEKELLELVKPALFEKFKGAQRDEAIRLARKLIKQALNTPPPSDPPQSTVIFFSADPNETKAAKVLGAMRVKIAEQLNLIEQNKFLFTWIVDYPMFEMNEDTKAVEFSHNPFSMPQGGLDALEKQDPLTICAYQYDLVCNGYELLSGAIRNHSPEIMYKAFALAGHPKETVDTEFAGMINAFKYGAPPHGGVGVGLDRVIMLLSGETSIREVIAFPLAQNGRDLLMNAPSPVSEKQLRDVHITIRKPVPKV
jgi:aspartyl-tRNA synthetase